MSDHNPCLLPEVDICAKYNISNAWCPPGWNALVCEALDQIFALEHSDQIEIHQIKEKFGTLRIYYGIKDSNDSSLYESVNLIVREAESKAGKTCQRCGQERSIIETQIGHVCDIPSLHFK